MNRQLTGTKPVAERVGYWGVVASDTALSYKQQTQHSVELIDEATTDFKAQAHRRPKDQFWLEVIDDLSVGTAISGLGAYHHEPAETKPLSSKQTTAISLLTSWCDGDEEEQRETFEFLKKALDEDRFSERKLFP